MPSPGIRLHKSVQSDITLLPNGEPNEGGPTKHTVFSNASSALGIITNGSGQKK